jgi:hypothetical protein
MAGNPTTWLPVLSLVTTNQNIVEFDRQLKSAREARSGSVPHDGIADAAVYVRDTLELALAAARSLDESASLEHAIAIYDRIEAVRLRLIDD